MTVIHGRHSCCMLNQFIRVPVKVSRLHTCIRQATVRTVNTVQQNRFSVSFHSCNENIPLTIPSSILPKAPTFRVFLLPYPSPRPGAILECYSVIDIIIQWTFGSFKVFVLIRMKTRAPTCISTQSSFETRDSRLPFLRNSALHQCKSEARNFAGWCDHYMFSKRLTSITQWRGATSTKYRDSNYTTKYRDSNYTTKYRDSNYTTVTAQNLVTIYLFTYIITFTNVRFPHFKLEEPTK